MALIGGVMWPSPETMVTRSMQDPLDVGRPRPWLRAACPPWAHWANGTTATRRWQGTRPSGDTRCWTRSKCGAPDVGHGPTAGPIASPEETTVPDKALFPGAVCRFSGRRQQGEPLALEHRALEHRALEHR